MTPENSGFDKAEYTVYPDKTYLINTSTKRVAGYAYGTEALKQAIYKIMSTVRYAEIIYSDSYGTELIDYMGRLTPYVWAELERCIRAALLKDDRISAVTDFEFEENKKSRTLNVSFKVVSGEGNFTYDWEVDNYV
jgi:hypothetical protein